MFMTLFRKITDVKPFVETYIVLFQDYHFFFSCHSSLIHYCSYFIMSKQEHKIKTIINEWRIPMQCMCLFSKKKHHVCIILRWYRTEWVLNPVKWFVWTIVKISAHETIGCLVNLQIKYVYIYIMDTGYISQTSVLMSLLLISPCFSHCSLFQLSHIVLGCCIRISNPPFYLTPRGYIVLIPL